MTPSARARPIVWGELTPRMRPEKPAFRRASANEPPISPTPKMAAVFICGARTLAQCHLFFSLLGLDRLWGRAMPCRWHFEPGGAIRGGARGYCELKSDSPRTQTGHGPGPQAPKSRFWENYMALRRSACRVRLANAQLTFTYS